MAAAAEPFDFTTTERIMSDRTQLAIGRNSISVPRLTKRFVEAALATALTSVVAFVILVLNNSFW